VSPNRNPETRFDERFSAKMTNQNPLIAAGLAETLHTVSVYVCTVPTYSMYPKGVFIIITGYK